MLHRDFDLSVPPYDQTDEIFADVIRHFDIRAANRMLDTPKLRTLLLPTVRAEFKMAYNFAYKPVEPFAFPVSSFVGQSDPWVSAEEFLRVGQTHFGRDSKIMSAKDRIS